MKDEADRAEINAGNWIDRAVTIAAVAHRNQLRKGSDTPYIVHPVAVGMILLQAGFSEEVVAAGILHDVIEDSPVTREEIREKFNGRIAELVAACSEPDRSLPWEQRKQHTLEFVRTAPLEVRAIVCADKLHNLRSMVDDYSRVGEKLWRHFRRGRREQQWYYCTMAKTLCDSFGDHEYCRLFSRFKQEAEDFFGE
jgi:(p)ppGpp synthase/HD superfamily hydrolase